MLTKHWIWQGWKLLTLLDHCHLVKNYFPELNSTSSGRGAHWEISSDPWNSLRFHHSWVLVTSPCHKIILWSLPLPSFFALQIRWSNYAAHLMTETLRGACYHIFSGIFRGSFNSGLCFKPISLFDLLQSLSYPDWITFELLFSLFVSGSLLLSSAMAPPSGKVSAHADAPCCLRSWLHFLFCLFLTATLQHEGR